MTESNLPAIRPFLPSGGVTFHTESEFPLQDVSTDLCRIASFLQHHDPSSKLDRFHDWWEHDGLHFPQGTIDFHVLFQIVGTPRSLIESMTGDDLVFIALSPHGRNWYLRLFADWDDSGSVLVGRYSISLSQTLVAVFSAEILPKLKCSPACEAVLHYFQRVEAK